jgi:hypothetical protein
VAERSKSKVYGKSLAGTTSPKPAGGKDVFLWWVSATGRSLVQRSPTDCGVSLCVI